MTAPRQWGRGAARTGEASALPASTAAPIIKVAAAPVIVAPGPVTAMVILQPPPAAKIIAVPPIVIPPRPATPIMVIADLLDVARGSGHRVARDGGRMGRGGRYTPCQSGTDTSQQQCSIHTSFSHMFAAGRMSRKLPLERCPALPPEMCRRQSSLRPKGEVWRRPHLIAAERAVHAGFMLRVGLERGRSQPESTLLKSSRPVSNAPSPKRAKRPPATAAVTQPAQRPAVRA